MRPLALLVAVGLAGCSIVNDPSRHQGGGGMDAGTDAGPLLVQASDFCRVFAELQCFAYFRCCGAAPDPSDELLEGCVTDASRACADDAISRLLLDPRTGYDPRVAGEVLMEGYALAEACSSDVLPWAAERSGVQRILTGTVDGGEACTPDDTSVTSFDYPALFSCEGSDRACVPVTDRDWSCLARRTAGQSCILYFDCEDGMMCDWAPLGTCQPRRGDGAACMNAIECRSLFCDGMPGTCRAPTQDDIYCGSLLPDTMR